MFLNSSDEKLRERDISNEWKSVMIDTGRKDLSCRNGWNVAGNKLRADHFFNGCHQRIETSREAISSESVTRIGRVAS